MGRKNSNAGPRGGMKPSKYRAGNVGFEKLEKDLRQSWSKTHRRSGFYIVRPVVGTSDIVPYIERANSIAQKIGSLVMPYTNLNSIGISANNAERLKTKLPIKAMASEHAFNFRQISSLTAVFIKLDDSTVDVLEEQYSRAAALANPRDNTQIFQEFDRSAASNIHVGNFKNEADVQSALGITEYLLSQTGGVVLGEPEILML